MAPADASIDAQSRPLHRLAVRDRALARRQSRRARRQSVHGVSGGAAARAGVGGGGYPDGGRRSRSRREPDARWYAAQRPGREGHGAGRRYARPARTGVVRVAESAVGESPDLRARRERAVGDEAATRSRHPHTRLAAPDRCLRGQLHLSARADPRRAGPGRGPRLPRRGTRCASAVAAVQATSAAQAIARRRRTGGMGRKGIHYAMQSGIFAARAIFQNLKSGAALAAYDRQVDGSYVRADLYRTRNMRLAFRDGFYLGGLQAGLMTLTGGRFPGGTYRMHVDVEVARRSSPGLRPGSAGKVDAVFKSGNSTRDTIPSHLIAPADVPVEVARFYSHMCPAGVYDATENGLRINAPNCVDCKATDVLGPRWTPREGGSGPKYKRM